MRILVTGATGFLGSHLCRELIHKGHRVTALQRPSSDARHLTGLDLEFRMGDMVDADSLAQAVDGQNVVIHAAADIRYLAPDSQLQQRINTGGSRALARACRRSGVARLVYVSSVAAIGIPRGGEIANENFRFNLEHSRLRYHLSKKDAEDAVLKEFEQGLDVVVVNPASIFGPHGETFRGGEMIYGVRRSRVVPYFVGGICAVHVDDVVAGTLSALERGASGERYILGGENLTYKELAQRSGAALGLRRRYLPVWPAVTALGCAFVPGLSYARHYAGSQRQFYTSGKAQSALGYRPRSFATILGECLRFANLDNFAPERGPVPMVKADHTADSL